MSYYFLNFIFTFFFFFFNDTATTEIYTLSLHDALPNSTRTLPSPASRNPRVRVTGRSSSAARPSARTRATGVVVGAEVMRTSLTARPDTSRRRPHSAGRGGPKTHGRPHSCG